MAAKRRSVSNDLGGGATRAVDPLFEFDAPQLFVDLTRAHRHLATGAGGALPPHDPWFDHVHDAHSKPSYELAQEEAEVQQQQQKSHHHHHHHHHYAHQQTSAAATTHHTHRHNSSATNGAGQSTAAVDSSASHHRHGATGLRARTSAGSASALNPSAALEKENRVVGPKRRATVFAAGLSTSTSSGTSGGHANGTHASTGSGSGALAPASSSTSQQPQQGLRSTSGATVSGLPARLRRRSAAGSGSSTDTTEPSAGASVKRMRTQIKTATVAAPVDSIAALRVGSSTSRSSDVTKRPSAASATTPQARSASATGSAATSASRLQKPRERTARFMAPTASSRIAAAETQAAADEQRGASVRSKAKAAVRRPAPSARSSGSGGATSDLQDLQDLQDLLARHNKKFKATHTYQPPQHSVRDVRVWEKKTQQSYYDLSPDARVRANSEIAELVKLAGATTPTSR